MPTEEQLVENFDNISYLNGPRIIEDDNFLKIKVDSINANAIAIFMASFVSISAAITYFMGGAENAILLLLGGSMAGGMLVAMMYGVAATLRSQSTPFINKKSDSLVLASGTIIAKGDIGEFRQYQCKPRLSNFRLVLTTVIVNGPEHKLEYAVFPVQGKFADDTLGLAFAKFLNAAIYQDEDRKFTADELDSMGVL